MNTNLEYKKIDRDVIEHHCCLASTEYTKQDVAKSQHLAWKYLENPQGETNAYHLWVDKSLIGKIVLQQRNFIQNGHKFCSAYLVDLLIHPSHRGIKTFIELCGKLKQTKELDFLFLTPNAKSIPLYKKVLRFDDIFHLDSIACPLNLTNLLKKLKISIPLVSTIATALWLIWLKTIEIIFSHLGELTVKCEPPTKTVFDEFINKNSPKNTLFGVRDWEFHTWRFSNSSLRSYKTYYLYDKSNSFLGYFTLRTMEYEDLNCLFIIDIFTATKLSIWQRLSILANIVHLGLKARVDLIFTLMTSNHRFLKYFRLFPFLKIPEKYLPQEVPVFFVDLSPHGKLTDNKSFYITIADLDVF